MRILLTLLCYFYLLASLSFPVLAEQDKEQTKELEAENKSSDETTVSTQTEQAQVEESVPIALIEQYKKDLQHYLDSEKVKPLLAGSASYLTLINPHTSPVGQGVAILLPDWEQGATNPKAINFLRQKLPSEGWTTIAVQPSDKPEGYPSNALLVEEQLKENKELIDEYQSKQKILFTALMNLAKEYPGIIIVIAQGNNGALLTELLSESESDGQVSMPKGMILLSSYRQTSSKLINTVNEKFATQLALTELPILDLFLQYDHPLTIAKAAQRNSLAKQKKKVYFRQRRLHNNATGYYPETELLSQIKRWLKSIDE